jgi:hypothetical protein
MQGFIVLFYRVVGSSVIDEVGLKRIQLVGFALE